MSTSLKLETLTQLSIFLLKRSDEAFARAETMRMLLEEHDVLSPDKFSVLFSRLAAERKEQTKQWLNHLLISEHSEELRRFLEAYKGTVQ